MVVGAIEPAVREMPLQPSEQSLVAGMHPERDLGLLTVAAKGTLADEQPDEQPMIELGQLWGRG
jgi:hypothetical protein